MKFEKKYFISRKNLVFMARDIEKDIYAERFYGGLVNIAGGQEVVRDTDDDMDRIVAPKKGTQRSCVPVLKKGRW